MLYDIFYLDIKCFIENMYYDFIHKCSNVFCMLFQGKIKIFQLKKNLVMYPDFLGNQQV